MFAYVGGYTSKDRNGRGDGINVYRVDEVSGAWTHAQRLGDLVNPSWLLLDRRRPVLYSAHGEGREAIAYAIEPATGRLRGTPAFTRPGLTPTSSTSSTPR